MRRTTIHLLTIALLVIAGASAALFTAGCGGNDEQAAFEQYLDDVRPALDDSLAGLETLATGLETASQTDPPDFAAAAEGCTAAAEKWAAAKETVDGIDVPEDLKKANDSLSESLGLEADLYGRMGEILAQAADSFDDPAKMAELGAQIEELDTSGVGQKVEELTAAWGDGVEDLGNELELEAPQWLEDWSDAIDEAGKRLEQI